MTTRRAGRGAPRWRRRRAGRALRALGVAWAAALAAGALAAAAGANTTVIGSTTLPAGGSQAAIGQGLAAFQHLAGDTSYVVSAPVSGTVTSWSYRNASVPVETTFVLRILRPTDVGPTQYTAVGTSPPQTVPDNLDAVRGPFPVSLPIKAGDRIAIESTSGSGAVPVFPGVTGADDEWLTTPFVADGASSPFTNGNDGVPNKTQVLVRATITYTPSAGNPAPPTAPPPPPASPAGRLSSLALPVAGVSVDLVPVSGRVLVRTPGSRTFVALSALGQQIPMGSEVDTTRGRVRLTAARSTGSTVTKTSDFYGGRFRVTQTTGVDARVDLALSGPLGRCRAPAPRRARPAHGARLAHPARRRRRAKRRRPRLRRVWGDGQGTFRTVGQRGAAAVRGTIWLVEDRCDGTTLVVVRRGTIAFQDFVRHRTIVVTAGHSYRAHPVRRPRRKRRR